MSTARARLSEFFTSIASQLQQVGFLSRDNQRKRTIFSISTRKTSLALCDWGSAREMLAVQEEIFKNIDSPFFSHDSLPSLKVQIINSQASFYKLIY